MGRTNDHITKKYKGTIEKMLFSGHKYGGAFDGIVLRLKNNKLMILRLIPFRGESIGPYIQEGQEVEVVASGDKLLLNKVLFKDLAMKDLEQELGKPIRGLGYLKQVQNSTGTYLAESKGNLSINTQTKPILNVKVNERIRLTDYEGMLVLENDDTLIYQFSGRFENTLNEEFISYLRAQKEGNGLYYKNPNIYRITSGNIKYSAKTAGFNALRHFGFGNDLLRKAEISSANLISANNGLVNGLSARVEGQKLDTFYFNSKSAVEIEQLVVKAKKNDVINLYYREMPNRKTLRAISHSTSEVIVEPLSIRYGTKEDYHSNKVNYQGSISKINYNKGKYPNRFESLILDDSVYIKLDPIVMLSILDLVEEGVQIQVQGWKRKKISSEIDKAGYTIVAPEHVIVYNIKFVNRTSLSTSQ
ncbi:hypothetical protein BFP97_14675 [Roseivirga sp. 4D4]|nr:hypothetical protein BFP97_14675 [Roseivirga sp. 4D4]